MTFKTLHVSVSIERPAEEVYAFVSNPKNLPLWASGLGASVAYVDGAWVVDSSVGDIKIEFVAQNTFGVLDHTITLESGESFYNPLRVIPNDRGSELIFTLFHRPDMTDELFAEDAKAIQHDLETIKRLLEA